MNENNAQTGKKYGRPKLPTEKRRDCFIKFSCSADEFQFIKKASELAGYKSHSNFLHNWLLRTLKGELFIINNTPEVNDRVVNLLTGACRNINQVAHRVNLQKGVDSISWEDFESNMAVTSAICCAAIKYASGYPDDGLQIIEELETKKINNTQVNVNFSAPSKLYSDLCDPLVQLSSNISQLVSISDLLAEKSPGISQLNGELCRIENLILSAINYSVGDFDLADSFYSEYVKLGGEYGNSQS